MCSAVTLHMGITKGLKFGEISLRKKIQEECFLAHFVIRFLILGSKIKYIKFFRKCEQAKSSPTNKFDLWVYIWILKLSMIWESVSEPTHSHDGLGHSGEHSGPQRVQQDLALQQDKVQQRGAVLRAQVHQQSAIVCPAGRGGENRGERGEAMSSCRERKAERKGEGEIMDGREEWGGKRGKWDSTKVRTELE